MNLGKQSGAALVVSLLLLLVMTVLAVTSINTSRVNLLIVRNLQDKADTESGALQAIETFLSDRGNFYNPQARSYAINGRNITVSAPDCLYETPASGYSASWSLAPQETHWELSAHDENSGGASTEMVQGVKINMLSGNC